MKAQASSGPPARQIRPVAAALFMLASCACFAMNSVTVRYVAADLHPFEIAFFRNVFAAAIIVPLAVRSNGFGIFRANRFDLLSGRAVVNSASMIAWATVLAALVLGETVRARRWTATAVGFLGAVVIIRPGFAEVNIGVWLILFSSAMWAATIIFVRVLTSHERPGTILVYQTLMLSAISLVPALFVWEWPRADTLVWLFLLGALTAMAHFCHVRAYSMQEVAALQPIDFARLPVVAVAAWLIFGETADIWVWIGAIIVFMAGVYISHREAQVKREAARLAAATAASATATTTVTATATGTGATGTGGTGAAKPG
jgi:drug/metabolite transporter (DMT)-like permease